MAGGRTERAFYYVRVIEIPTPRWTAYDAKRFGIETPDEIPMTVQDRAYTDLVHAGVMDPINESEERA